MRPNCSCFISSSTSWAQSIGARRLMAIVRSKSFSDEFSNRSTNATPALFTSPVIGPFSRSISNALEIDTGFVRSVAIQLPSWSSGTRMSRLIVFQPSYERRLKMALPIPRLAPVTMAVLVITGLLCLIKIRCTFAVDAQEAGLKCQSA